jgi:hypothetical protein
LSGELIILSAISLASAAHLRQLALFIPLQMNTRWNWAQPLKYHMRLRMRAQRLSGDTGLVQI